MDALRAALAAAAAKASEARAANAEAQIAAMKLTIGKLGRALYGQRSERKQRLLDQLELQLDKLEASAPEDELTAEQAAAGATQVKGFPRRRPARKPFPEHLPRERAVAPAPRACECCGSQKLSKIGEDITGTLEVIPRRWKAIRTVREKFTCRACEKIGQPPAPFHPTPRGRAGPNLLAMIPFEKFGQHQPLNRQRERYAREGVDPGLPTPVDRVGPGAVALKPLHDLIASHVPAADRLHGDDTPAPVLARGRTDTVRAWIYGRDDKPFGGPDPPAALFRYSRNRSGDRPVEHLRSYAGILQADAFAGYNRSCPRRWCKSLSSVAVSGGWGRAAQSAAAGDLTVVLSLTGAMASSVMYPALWTAPSSRGGLEALAVVADRQLDAAPPAAGRGAKERGPEGPGLGRAARHAAPLAAAPVVDRHRDGGRDRDAAPGLAPLRTGRVPPQIRPVALQRAVEEVAALVVDPAA